MQIQKFTVNHFGQNTYLIIDEHTKACAVIDPGFFFEKEKEDFKDVILSQGLKLEKILFTHCHLDHAFGARYVYEEFPVIDVIGHKDEMFFIDDAINQSLRFGIKMEQPPAISIFINEGDKVTIGSVSFQTFHVPGHSKGSICYYNKDEKIIIVGDVLFAGSVGRSDLPGGNHDILISGIRSKLMTLPNDVVVYSGHGPETTIGVEKTSNPFLH